MSEKHTSQFRSDDAKDLRVTSTGDDVGAAATESAQSNSDRSRSKTEQADAAPDLVENMKMGSWSGSSPRPDVPPEHRMKVLMADDNEMMRLLLNTQLKGWGLDVITATDGDEAWELFQKHQPPLVLTDWMMPGIDGLELIRRIRSYKLEHYVYVILLTAKSGKEDLVKAMDIGADDFLNKPCDNQELRVRLREGTRILRLEKTLAEKNLEIRKAQAALVQSEKLAGLGQLAAGMAHEINNPIAYVTNNLVVLQRDVAAVFEILDAYRRLNEQSETAAPKEPQQAIRELESEHDIDWIRENTPETFEACISGLSRVRDIVRDLREFARLDEAEYDVVSLGRMIRSTLAMLKHQIDKKNLTVQIDDPSEATLQCRPASINQLLHHLLSNAVQACEQNDLIDIRIRLKDEHVVLTVRDTGSGIAPEDLPKVFEPFFTTRDIGQGKGLGLSHCYGVVHDHGGEIELQSEPGAGTTVRVALPQRAPLGSADQPASRHPTAESVDANASSKEVSNE